MTNALTGIDNKVRGLLDTAGWFRDDGAYVLVDGQYGSTGKGLMASVLAEYGGDKIDTVTTNAGPNSGHTAYHPWTDDKIVTQQIPVAAVVLRGMGLQPNIYLNAGAVLDPDILMREMAEYHIGQPYLYIHPHAAIIEDCDREVEALGPIAAIASTGKGVGSALARKIRREGNVFLSNVFLSKPQPNRAEVEAMLLSDRVLVETAQGFSLGINSGFYPFTTSRECTVMQAIADARIPWNAVRRVCACYRTYPIRVGNTAEGNSGPVYDDQVETSWEALGLEPEYTTVTKRVRRVFTWSRQQFMDSVRVNQPDTLFINFMNYLKEDDRMAFVQQAMDDYFQVMDKLPAVLLGFGPRNSDVEALTWVL